MRSADWLSIFIPSGVMILSAILVHISNRRANANQKKSLEVQLKRIEDDLRNQCVVELHRRKIAAYSDLMQDVSALNNHLISGEDHDSDDWGIEHLRLLNCLDRQAAQTSLFTSESVFGALRDYLNAIGKWIEVAFAVGTERDAYISAFVDLVLSIQEDLGIQAIPKKLFSELISRTADLH